MNRTKFLGGLLTAVLLATVILAPAAAAADSAEGLAVTVTPSLTTASSGDNISYSYLITSTCNTTIESLALTDTKFGDISLTATSIAPGENISASLDFFNHSAPPRYHDYTKKGKFLHQKV